MTDSYVALDVETTGLDPKRDKIIEIGMVKVRSGKIAAQFESFVNPGRPLTERIIELTGIRNEQLSDARDIGEIMPEVLRFIGDDILVGHRILFDYSFIKKAAVNHRYTFEKTGIDTLKLAKTFLPDLESRSGHLPMPERLPICIRSWRCFFIRETKRRLRRNAFYIR